MHFVDDKLLLYSLPELQCCCHPSQMVICVFNFRVDLSPPPFSSSSYTNKQEDRSRHAEGARLRRSLWHSLRQLLSDAWLEDLIGCAGLCAIEESLGCVVYGRTMTKPVIRLESADDRSRRPIREWAWMNMTQVFVDFDVKFTELLCLFR